jgi:hypothetical protein
MVLNKEVTWCMCLDLQSLNKLTIKDKFPIPDIDGLLDDLSGAHYFTKLLTSEIDRPSTGRVEPVRGCLNNPSRLE